MELADISYLREGTPIQRRVYGNISELGILDLLKPYDATLVATFCNQLNVEGSDLDVICEVHDVDEFTRCLKERFGELPGYHEQVQLVPTTRIVVTFFFGEFPYEVFGEPVPVKKQNAYRHLLQTNRVLSLGGSRWLEEIRALKRQGIKTEPAVAQCLGLPGDPYQAILSLEEMSEDELSSLMTLRHPTWCS